MITTARKTQLCGTPDAIRKTLNQLCTGLNPREVSAEKQLRVLAAELAQRDDVTVSAVTYENQWMELEVLLSAAPALAPIVIDLGKFGDQCLVSWERWLNIGSDATIRDTAALVVAVLKSASGTALQDTPAPQNGSSRPA